MNGTPRLRSAYPSTPRTPQNSGQPSVNADQTSGSLGAPAQKSAAGEAVENGPLVPLTLLDAPTQRFYVSAFYAGLTAWRLLDYSGLVTNDTDSLWLFMKWVAIDGAFLYGMPELRIPWLEWSSTTMTALFLVHAILNAVLMFRIPIPLEAWLLAFTRMIYDRELAVSERRVKPASLLHNSSLILGKQIVHILPEGSAMLNPGKEPYCIDATTKAVSLPIFINQTNPMSIELLRIDLETNNNEILTIPPKELKKLKKQADKHFNKNDIHSPRVLDFSVNQPGLYRLNKVLDESNLEVHKIMSDTLVVRCPSGYIKPVPHDKCRGSLSDFHLHVDGTPPLKVKYSKSVNSGDQTYVFLTAHPENLETPLARQKLPGSLTSAGDSETDVSWARAHRLEIPVNETLGVVGEWLYTLDEIHDASGNVVNYTAPNASKVQRANKESMLQQHFNIHDRPRAILDGCSSQDPLRVAKGKSRHLPVRFNPTGQHKIPNAKHYISYSFKSDDDSRGEQYDEVARFEKAIIGPNERGPEISEPGIYSLMSVATDYCPGEVLEPSSCLLSNPPEPELSVTSEGIPHQCAGNSVGLRVNLDLIGTPPFEISYNVYEGSKRSAKVEKVKEMRAQIEFKPRDAGHYVYEFLDIADSVYRIPRSLKQANIKLEQDVKPTAWASFATRSPQRTCIQEPASFDVHLSGEGPWALEYDLVHKGKRTKHKLTGIEESYYTLTSPNLDEGGHYSISLTGVTDAAGCRIHLQDEAQIDVRHQRPGAAFGLIDGRRSVFTLQDQTVDLPLRLSGESPWTITYSIAGDESRIFKQRLEAANDFLVADSEELYYLREVSDRFCPGTVDAKANQFEVLWTPRPTLKLAESSTIERRGSIFHKRAVCEGDQDAMELSFTGSPPYYLKYDVHVKPLRGPASVRTKQDKFGLHAASIGMETTRPGTYEYKLLELGDQLYDHNRGSTNPTLVQQKVNGRPAASFSNTGKTYNYCKEDALGDEVLPITLTGSSPFSVEIAIKHHAATAPEIVNIPRIEGNRYDFRIPHNALSFGMHTVSIGKVTDANGCQRGLQPEGKATRVNVVDVPSISPMDAATDFCVGDRIAYTLAGTPPFNVHYIFEGTERKASASTNSFRRIAEKPGNFTVIAISDKASSDKCRAHTNFTKLIHPLPSVRISKGKTTELDIHEGGEADLLFEFEGTPPFEFTWTRSTNAANSKKAKILETKTDMSYDYAKSIPVSEEGTYEVVSIRDRFCGVSVQKKRGQIEQQLLTF